MKKKKRRFRIKKVPPVHVLQFGLLIVLCLIAYIQPNRLIIHIFLLVLIVCIVDGMHFFSVRNKLRVDINGGPPVEKNEAYRLQVELVNHAGLPSSFFHMRVKQSQRLRIVGKDEISALLEPKGKLKYEIIYETRLSGEDTIGIETGRLDSLFGFFRVNIPLEMYIKVRVLPEIRSISEIEQFAHTLWKHVNSDRNGNIERSMRMGEEVGYDLRPYQEGDSQRLIHWKLAALKDSYLVREREGGNDQKQDVYFVLCPLQQEIDEEGSAIIQDKTVTSIVSMAYHFLNHEQTVKVACYIHKSWKYLKLESILQIRDLQELLSKYHSIERNEKVDEKQIIKSLTRIWHQHQGIKILVSAYWNKKLQEVLLEEEAKASISIVWTGSMLLKQLAEEKTLPIWYIDEAYRIERIK